MKYEMIFLDPDNNQVSFFKKDEDMWFFSGKKQKAGFNLLRVPQLEKLSNDDVMAMIDEKGLGYTSLNLNAYTCVDVETRNLLIQTKKSLNQLYSYVINSANN